MSKDYIAEQISWLDGIITDAENSSLFSDETQSAIQKELADRWIEENRLELLNDLSDRFGEAEVLVVIDKIIYANCRKGWEQIGKEKGNNSLDNFLKMLWGPLQEIGFEYSFEKEGNKTKFRVTKCPVYDLAQALGAERWLYHLVCLTDEPSVVGFNSQVEFSRTKTLMQGYPECDHCYTDLSA
jgi:hypothetical protein